MKKNKRAWHSTVQVRLSNFKPCKKNCPSPHLNYLLEVNEVQSIGKSLINDLLIVVYLLKSRLIWWAIVIL